MLHVKKLICCAVASTILTTTNSQGLLKKIKDKAQQTADKIVDKKIDEKIDESAGNNNGNTDMSSVGKKGRPTNKTGAGLISTPPNVNENLTAAETAFKAANYSDARNSIRQALVGVQMEIGKKILAELPETVSGMKKDPDADQVTSSGWGLGFAGLTIQRDYNQDDKQLSLTIANNAAWMQAVNLYFTNSAYMQTSNGEQKWKQLKVQEEKAIIEFDANSGYKLSIPVGQTTLMIYEGVNFATEQDFLNAVNQIKIASIKKNLGEK